MAHPPLPPSSHHRPYDPTQRPDTERPGPVWRSWDADAASPPHPHATLTDTPLPLLPSPALARKNSSLPSRLVPPLPLLHTLAKGDVARAAEELHEVPPLPPPPAPPPKQQPRPSSFSRFYLRTLPNPGVLLPSFFVFFPSDPPRVQGVGL